MTDTIFALATPLPATAALVRVSGPGCAPIFRTLSGAEWPRTVLEAALTLPAGRVPCFLWASPAPGSYTGEDTLEILLPGNPWLVRQCEDWLTSLRVRRAEPGEFTRRALANGKLTASQAQATLALVNAQDDAARRAALAELSGEAATHLRALTERLRGISARFEMLFDFAEEEHAHTEEAALAADLRTLAGDLRVFCGTEKPRPPRHEPIVALFGPPNAGKSSLFNALIGRPRALVSPRPGTTRDPVEAVGVFEGTAARLCDLSGVGEADSDAGRFAETARERALTADVVLVLAAPGQTAEAERELEKLRLRDADVVPRVLWVDTMSDVARDRPARDMPALSVSALSGGGLRDLRAEIHSRLLRAAVGEAPSLLREQAREACAMLEQAVNEPAPPEATAQQVRRALTLLDEALLADVPGDVLALIFSRFCIGK